MAVFVVIASGLLALLLGGGAVGAAPAPASPAAASASPASRAPLLDVNLPGLLSVSVDLPEVKVGLLGGGGRTAAGNATTAPSATTPASTAATPTSAPAPTRSAPARRVTPVRSQPASTEPRRNRDAAAGATGVAAVDDRQPSSARPARTSPPVAARPGPQAFVGMLRTGLPIWLLAGIVALCGFGTVLVVRAAGRRPRGSSTRS